MKTMLKKILLISLLLSTAVSSNVQANWSIKAKDSLTTCWNNKLVRCSTYTIGTIALYVGLAQKGYLPGFSAVKNSLLCAWQEKNLKAPMNVYQSIPGSIQATQKTAKAVRESIAFHKSIASGIEKATSVTQKIANAMPKVKEIANYVTEFAQAVQETTRMKEVANYVTEFCARKKLKNIANYADYATEFCASSS